MQLSLSLKEILAIVGPAELRGDTSQTIVGIASLNTAVAGDLSFLGNPKYKHQVATTRASAVLVPTTHVGNPHPGQAFIVSENPSAGLARLCAHIEQTLWPKPTPGIHPTSVVAPGAQIAASATIGPFCVIESGVKIGESSHLQANIFIGHNTTVGDHCWLMPRVVVMAECILKDRIRLHPGVVVGSNGLGYEFVQGKHERLPQVGIVLVENDVVIGANSTVDRGRFDQTRIGEGTKIDNLVQIAHNVIIGKHCIICAHVGIAGSAVVEDYVVLGGQAGVAGHLTVGRGSRVDGQTGVNTDLAPNSKVKGSPMLPYQLEQRVNVLKRQLPELFKRVDVLEEQLKKASALS